MLVYLHTIFKWQIFPFSAFSVRSYFLFWHSLILIVITLAKCVICNAFIHDQLKCDRRHRSHCEWIFIFFSLSLLLCVCNLMFGFRLSLAPESKHSAYTKKNHTKLTAQLYISVHFNINLSRCRSWIFLANVFFMFGFYSKWIGQMCKRCFLPTFTFINFMERSHQSLFCAPRPGQHENQWKTLHRA